MTGGGWAISVIDEVREALMNERYKHGLLAEESLLVFELFSWS